jgi:hypothetical protein
MWAVDNKTPYGADRAWIALGPSGEPCSAADEEGSRQDLERAQGESGEAEGYSLRLLRRPMGRLVRCRCCSLDRTQRTDHG